MTSDTPAIVRAVETVEDSAALDPAIDRANGIVRRLLRPKRLRDLLNGKPLGHPAHPVAILVPAGAWISSAVLDFLPGQERASQALVGVGLLGVVPAASAGIADWSLLDRRQQRVGIVHWAANLAAVALYSASYVQRSRGKQASGRALGLLGLTVVSASGYLGGHLAYRQGANVLPDDAQHGHGHGPVPELVHDDEPDFAEATAEEISTEWQTLGLLDGFQDGKLTSAETDGAKLVVFRNGIDVAVLVGTCSFCDDELSHGEVGDADGVTTVECPQDASVFDLATGAVLRGPATAPLVRFDAIVNAGMVEIRRAL